MPTLRPSTGVVAATPSEACPAQFAGFPRRSLLESADLPIEEVARLALREGQCTNPLYRVHRWFARRLSSQFRTMLAALTLRPAEADRFWDRYFGHIPLDGAVVFDPFVGGGTSVVEASRCNARVIGYDIDPVATAITRFELESPSWDQLPPAIEAVTVAVAGRVRPLHRTKLPGGGTAEVLHHFWVEMTACRHCGHEFEVHPHYLLAFDVTAGRQWAFCRACHEVKEQPHGAVRLDCGCGESTPVGEGTLSAGKLRCPACVTVQDLVGRGGVARARPVWRLFAQEYIEGEPRRGEARRFKRVSAADRAAYRRAERLLAGLELEEGVFAPSRAIPPAGRSDRRPLIHGFRHYRELFNARQLLHLSVLGRAISEVDDEKAKRLLGLAFSEHLATNNMYVGYAFGYRRVSPLFSIHSFRHIVRPVELNPWMSGAGRGTFPSVLNKLRRAVAFAKAPTDLHPDGGRRPGHRPVGPTNGVVGRHPRDVVLGRCQAAIRTQNSRDLSGLQDGSVDLVLTDPPYFDNLSYSELSDFYLSWHQALGIAEGGYADPSRSAPLRANLAVNGRSGDATPEYGRRLTAILCECRRVLHPRGVCVFTYHHKSAAAWAALGAAVVRSGFRVSAVLPLRGEGQGGLHSYDGTIKWDAVLVCRKAGGRARGSGEEVVVTTRAAAAAAAKADTYWRRLAGDDRIGFRHPDRLNLYRAFLVAAARLGTPSSRLLGLGAALDIPLDC